MIGSNRGMIVGALQPGESGARLRFGTVVSVESNRTCTVTIGGSSSQVIGVKYVAHVVPLPGAGCILASDGADLFILAVMAAADRTLAPRAYRTADQSIPDATDTAVTWQAVNSDAWVCWASGQATRLTAPLSGRYVASGAVKFAANGTGFRALWVAKNGTEEVRVNQAPAAAGTPTIVNVTSAPFDLAKGDYVQLFVRQSSGGALNLTRDSTSMPSLGLRYLGP